jgi:ATP-dependent Clp protease ATP-binding subunit ClpA
VFERFTDGARECVVLGQEEAYAAEADAVGTEHMLLGLLDQGDQLVADALRVAGFPERAAQVSLADPRPNREVHIPFSPEAAAVLRRSREVSAALGEAQTRPGHLLCRSSRSTFAWAPATGSFSSQTIPPPADGIAADTEHGRAVAFAFCCGPA